MTFDAYLIEKKTDSAEVRAGEPARWQEWALLFEQVSLASFTSQKLYLINPLCREYRLKKCVGADPPRQACLKTENSIALCMTNFDPL